MIPPVRKGDFIKTVRRPYPPFYTTLIDRGISAFKHYAPVLKKKYAMRSMVKIDELWWYGRKDAESCSEIAFES